MGRVAFEAAAVGGVVGCGVRNVVTDVEVELAVGVVAETGRSRSAIPGQLRQLMFQLFFSSRRRHTRSKRDWSSDVCSSDLVTTGPTMYLLPMTEVTPSFDTARDFVPVSLLARFEFAVVASPSINATDFQQFVAWLKANPGKATFGVPSSGTIPHFIGSKLEQVLGIPMTRVAYRGSAPIVNDHLGGHLPFGITTVADVAAQHRAGGVRALAVTSAVRSPFLPDVPTLKDSGVDLVADAWYGMWLPAGSPPEFARRLSAAAGAALARPEVKEKLLAIGLIPVGTSPEGLDAELAANTAFWQPIVKATGYKITN